MSFKIPKMFIKVTRHKCVLQGIKNWWAYPIVTHVVNIKKVLFNFVNREKKC